MMHTKWLALIGSCLMLLAACGGGETPATSPPEPTQPPTDIPVQAVNPEDTCPAFVSDALTETDSACDITGRNQACYGNTNITANPKADVTDFQFAQPGDIVDVVQLQSLKLAPLDLTTQTWGIALMRLQANLSETTPGQNVTFLMFGDVELENRSADDTTNIQSFYFASGIGDSACASAPESGLLIQTPEGVGKIDLLINEVDIKIGSTAYLQAQPNADMIVNVVEGQAEVSSQGETQVVDAGNRTRIGLDENGIADSPPALPEPYDIQPLRQLPVRSLPRPIEITEQVETVGLTSIGFEVFDTIGDPAEVDIFELDGVAGQRIYLDALGEVLSLRWSLHLNRPDNADVIEDNETRLTLIPNVSTDIGLVELPESGTYQIVVYSRNDGVGDYQFKVWDVPPPDEMTLTLPDDAPEQLIGMGSGMIETPGSSDVYALTVEAGEILYLDGISSDSGIKWNVYGDEGESFVYLNYDVWVDLEAITFEVAGTYELRVWGHDDAIGSYEFQIWDVPPVDDLVLTLPDDAPPELLGTGSGMIETPGVEDLYTLTVDAGEILYLDGISSDSGVKWNIYQQDGEAFIYLNYDVRVDLENIVFETADDYVLRVWGHEDAIGAYEFKIWDVPPVEPLVPTLPDDAPQQLFGSGSGMIESPGAEDLYIFTVEAGQVLYFDGISSDSGVKWNVFDVNDEAFIYLNYDVRSDLEDIVFETVGTYTMRVWGHEDAIGAYEFQIWDVPPPDELDLTTGAGIVGRGSGDIESPGAEDHYMLIVDAGETLFFDGIASDSGVKWNILDAEGTELVNLNYDVRSDLENITFEAGGMYTIRIWGHEDAIGTYEFEIREEE